MKHRKLPERKRFGAGRLFRDASALASSSLVNAAFGMATWAIMAHLIPPSKLGVMTAVLAAITAPALAIATTVGDAYVAILPGAGHARPAVFRLGQRFFLVASTVGGVVAGLATVMAIHAVRGSLAIWLLVVVGTVLNTAFLLQNYVLTSLGRASWLVSVNGSMNILKVALLFALTVSIQWHALELAAVASAGLVAAIISPMTRRMVNEDALLPQGENLVGDNAVREFTRFIPRSFMSTVLCFAIFSLTPFLVTAFSGPTQGAVFALCLPLAQLIDVVSTAMGTSLVVHASTDPHAGAAMARSILSRAIPIAVVSAIGLAIVAPLILRKLNPAYGSMSATVVLAVLCTGSVLRVPFSTWAALQRSRRTFRAMLIVAFFGAAVVVTAVPILSHRYGALGGALGLIPAYLVLSGGAALHTLFGRRSERRSNVANRALAAAAPRGETHWS